MDDALSNLTFFLIFFITAIVVFFFYFYGAKRRVIFPQATSVWSFWRAQATPAVRKEFVASRSRDLQATLAETGRRDSTHEMRLCVRNTSPDEISLSINVTPSLGARISMNDYSMILEGNSEREITFEAEVSSGRQSITVGINATNGETLFYETHVFHDVKRKGTAQDYLGLLGLSEGATKSQIRRKRRQLAKKYHPDKGTDKKDKETMLEKMKEINRAYAALKEMGYV